MTEIIVIAVYLVPSWIAFTRGHQNAGSILLLNLLLGWTVLGWIAALGWALTRVTARRQRSWLEKWEGKRDRPEL